MILFPFLPYSIKLLVKLLDVVCAVRGKHWLQRNRSQCKGAAEAADVKFSLCQRACLNPTHNALTTSKEIIRRNRGEKLGHQQKLARIGPRPLIVINSLQDLFSVPLPPPFDLPTPPLPFPFAESFFHCATQVISTFPFCSKPLTVNSLQKERERAQNH